MFTRNLFVSDFVFGRRGLSFIYVIYYQVRMISLFVLESSVFPPVRKEGGFLDEVAPKLAHSVETTVRRRRILFAGFVARMGEELSLIHI